MSNDHFDTDYLVIGSGLAGLFFALKMAENTKNQVTILSKAPAVNSATAMAQGGIASVVADDDSFESHIQDTVTAGAGLCKEDVVRFCVQEGPERIADLLSWGVLFQGDLTREGGHSHKRILHSFDQTGLAIQTALLAKVKSHPNIQFFEDRMVVDLILKNKKASSANECLGAYILNFKTGHVESWSARATIMATGGAGKVYLYTSNWDGATGDGIAIARRAGCRVVNMEFLQFHPTCLFHPKARNFLITEAMRGEGAELVLKNGSEFMQKYHPQKSLAPRDIVARAIDNEIKKSGDDCVFLDATRILKKSGDTSLSERFPNIYKRCFELGIDIDKEPIPVVPAAHYLCGGIWTDSVGKTDIPRLFAVGENAWTGLHGANRLASNSLMEATVFSNRAAEYLLKHQSEFQKNSSKPDLWNVGKAVPPDEAIIVSHNWDEIRRLMWNYVGIVRSNKRLERALHRIKNLQEEIRDYYWNFTVDRNLLELRNIALIAELMIQSALSRKESRGIHYNLDYPNLENGPAKDTIL